jgi:hypothetical protein
MVDCICISIDNLRGERTADKCANQDRDARTGKRAARQPFLVALVQSL